MSNHQNIEGRVGLEKTGKNIIKFAVCHIEKNVAHTKKSF
jgi:hypothetical protein